MNRRILLGMTFALTLVLVHSCAFAQAAAESALVKAGSAAATAKAGTALGSALDRSSKQLAGRVQQQVRPPAPAKTSQVEARPVSTSPVEGTAVREGTSPGQGPVIASIQGGGNTCVPTAPTASTPATKTAAESAQAAQSSQDCARKPAPQHQSVITVSFSK